MSSVLERLGERLTQAVEESDRARAALHLSDWLACVAGARRSEVTKVGRRLGDPLATAALLGNVLEMDDVHRVGRLHPGPVIWPAVLQVARTRADMLDGAIAGYEAMIAVGASLDDRHYAHWHPTATAGIIGAAAAAARAMGLDATAIATAMAHAGSVAGGLWHMRHGGSMTKQVHIMHAAEAGVRCAQSAAAGLTGAVGVIEGPQGLWEAMCSAPGDVRTGDRWRIEEVSFKPWAACRHAHPAIDAALAMPGTPDALHIETYADALTFCDRPDPRTPAEARFSLQHSVAVALTHGDPKPEHFEPDTIKALAGLRARISVAENAAFTREYPEHFGARLCSGDLVIERRDTLGDPERPLRPEQHREKLVTLCTWGDLAEGEAERAERTAGTGPTEVRQLLTEWLA